jgi:hypothetical protein
MMYLIRAALERAGLGGWVEGDSSVSSVLSAGGLAFVGVGGQGGVNLGANRVTTSMTCGRQAGTQVQIPGSPLWNQQSWSAPEVQWPIPSSCHPGPSPSNLCTFK